MSNLLFLDFLYLLLLKIRIKFLERSKDNIYNYNDYHS